MKSRRWSLKAVAIVLLSAVAVAVVLLWLRAEPQVPVRVLDAQAQSNIENFLSTVLPPLDSARVLVRVETGNGSAIAKLVTSAQVEEVEKVLNEQSFAPQDPEIGGDILGRPVLEHLAPWWDATPVQDLDRLWVRSRTSQDAILIRRTGDKLTLYFSTWDVPTTGPVIGQQLTQWGIMPPRSSVYYSRFEK